MLNRNRAGSQLKGDRPVIVASGAQVGALGKTNVGLKYHFIKVIDPNLATDPAVVTNRQFPGVFDSHVGVNNHVPTNCRAKHPEQPGLK